MLLAGDIGGTKTVLALIPSKDAVRQPLLEDTYASAEFDSLEAIIADFLQQVDINQVTSASFGVAGPVIDDEAEITNLPWVINAARVAGTFDICQVHLLNDLESIANAIPYLETSDLATINVGYVDPTGAIAVIAPGTGLGEAFLTWKGGRYQPHPSEGGHASFAPHSLEQRKLLGYLQARFGHVSCERVCSGSGIPNIYDFLRDTGRFKEPPWLRQALDAADDRTPIIAQAAEAESADICVATMNLFVDILAGEAGNMALKVLATGGVYLGGGIPPRILPRLQQERFMETFKDKGRFTELLENVPIHVILNPRVALCGAAYYGLEHST